MGVTRAIYPGSFDPVTVGHIDVIRRATQVFDEVLIAVAQSDSKSPLFPLDERVALLEDAVRDLPGARVTSFDGLLVDFARARDTFVVIRGLRAVSDFEFEFQMALTNRRLEPRLETLFLTPREDCTFLSSRIVKEVARLGGAVDDFVPPAAAAALKARFAPKTS